jgi:hypothetical protein
MILSGFSVRGRLPDYEKIIRRAGSVSFRFQVSGSRFLNDGIFDKFQVENDSVRSYSDGRIFGRSSRKRV